MKKKLLTPDRGLKAITYHFVLLSPTKKIMKKIFLLLCAIGYIGIYVQPTYAQSNYGFLHRDNREIVNDDGPILLKGLNLGNWLVTEAYLWGWNPTDKNYSKFDAPTKFKNELFDLLGTQANVDLFYNTWRNNFLTEADVVEIANKGYNSIRVPFHSNQVYDIATDQFRTELFQYIDNLVTWCANNKIYVILDMHCAVGAQNKQGHSDYLGDNYLYSDDNYDQNINYKKLNAKVWKHIADHYKNEPWIGGYDLVNESVIDVQSEKWKLRDHYVAITNAIREVDNNHIVFAEGNYYGSDLWDLDPRWA